METDDATVSFNMETIALIGRISTREKCESVIAALSALLPFLSDRATPGDPQ